MGRSLRDLDEGACKKRIMRSARYEPYFGFGEKVAKLEVELRTG